MATETKGKDLGFGFKSDGTPRQRAAPKSGTRTAKPIFAIVKYTDPNTGSEMKLDREHLNITFEKDASNLVTLLTGEGMGNATVVKVELPGNDASAAATEAPAAA